MYETRKELIKKMHDLCEDLNECEVELESKKEPNDINRRLDSLEGCVNIINGTISGMIKDKDEHQRRLDRVEECVAFIGNRLRDPGDMLLKNIRDIYEEQAAAREDQDE